MFAVLRVIFESVRVKPPRVTVSSLGTVVRPGKGNRTGYRVKTSLGTVLRHSALTSHGYSMLIKYIYGNYFTGLINVKKKVCIPESIATTVLETCENNITKCT